MYSNTPMTNEFFVCACSSDEHTLRFVYDPDTNDMWASVYLDPKRWYRRLWVALRYVFGYQCRYGAFDCFLFDSKDADRMIATMTRVKEWKKDDQTTH
jgi:hypothetical protein